MKWVCQLAAYLAAIGGIAHHQQVFRVSVFGRGREVERASQDGLTVDQFAGKWSVAGEVLTCEYTRSSCENIPAGTRDQDKLLELAKNYYLIEAMDGMRRTYSRVE